jgi:hypothetical protein
MKKHKFEKTLNTMRAKIMLWSKIVICFCFYSLTTQATAGNKQTRSYATLSVLSTTATIDATDNNSAIINISSNTSWTATSSESWLTLSTAGATGNQLLTCNATNTLEATRTAIVTISAPGLASKTVTVTQNWGVNVNKYQLSMTVTSVAAIDDNEIASTDYKIAVFIGDECRAVGDLRFVSSKNRYMANLNVTGNAEDVNKIVTFRCFNKTNNAELTATNASLVFMPGTINGSISAPYITSFVEKVTAVDREVKLKVRLYPNPVKEVLHIESNAVNIQQLQLIDAVGNQLLENSNNNSTDIITNHLANGIYFLRIKSNGLWTVQQFIKQ